MNIYEHHEPVFGMRGSFEKFLIFASATGCFMFIVLHVVHFLSVVRQISEKSAFSPCNSIYFMNQMKIYEEG
jgi:hypothetical protein